MAFIFSFWWVWILVAFTVTEVTSIVLRQVAKRQGHSSNRFTFSWHVWWVRRRWYTRAPVFALMVWAMWHFWFEPVGYFPKAADDVAVFVVALLVGLGIRPHGREAR